MGSRLAIMLSVYASSLLILILIRLLVNRVIIRQPYCKQHASKVIRQKNQVASLYARSVRVMEDTDTANRVTSNRTAKKHKAIQDRVEHMSYKVAAVAIGNGLGCVVLLTTGTVP